MKKWLLAAYCLFLGNAYAQKTLTVGNNDDLRIRFDTRITFDAAAYASHTDLDGIKYGGDDFRYSSGTNLSQLRFGLVAILGKKWSGKFDANFSDRKVFLTDVVINYQINPTSKLIMGYYKDPVSMENNTASKYLSVATPMAVGMLSRGERYVGATYVHWGQHYWFSGGIYGGSLSPSSMPQANRGDDGFGVGMRAAYVPIDNEYTTLHLGVYGRWRQPDGMGGHVRDMAIGGLPESGIDRHRFVSGTVRSVKHYWVGGTEGALRFDKLFLTGEYLFNSFSTINNTNSFIHGWTLTASYMLLGKQRKYQKADAIFNPTGNLDNLGGLELIGRVGSVNLNDLNNASTPLKAGSALSAMVGLNWYPIPNLLFGLNYTYSDQDQYALEKGMIHSQRASALEKGLDFSAIHLRAQIIF